MDKLYFQTVKVCIGFCLTILTFGCDLGPNPIGLGSATSTGGLSLIPESTTLSVNQSVTFQVSGGTAPYSYQTSGVGTVNTSGTYYAGASPGTGTITVTDSTGLTGTAAVTVVETSTTSSNTSTTSSTSNIAIGATGNSGVNTAQAPSQANGGWQPVNSNTNKAIPILNGKVIGTSQSKLDENGNVIESKFIKTNLQHPIVRTDELVQGNRTIAFRAVIEDQFIVKLTAGHVEADLVKAVTAAGGFISKKIDSNGTYLVSINKEDEPSAQTVDSAYLERRKKMKTTLQAVGVVSPNTINQPPSAAPVAN